MTDPSRVTDLLIDWQLRRDRGDDVEIEDVCREHPLLATELRRQADALRALENELRGDATSDAARLQPLRADKYTVFRRAGSGGMGVVYLAIDEDLHREVAFKIVRPPIEDSDAVPEQQGPLALTPPPPETPASAAFRTLKMRFLQEAWITAAMEHPGIVPVYELGETPEGVPYYTMRFVRGNRTLAGELRAVRERPIEERLALLEPLLKVCDTLRYAHARGVIHRDLKPENIAIGEFGEVVVLDWGLAKFQDRPDVVGEVWRDELAAFRAGSDLETLAGALGTPGFMSPEAALGRVDEVGPRSDVYSLGAILYELLTGCLPFEFDTYGELIRQLRDSTPSPPATRDPAVPLALSELCVRALARAAAERPETVGEFADEIRAWQAARIADVELEGYRQAARAALALADTSTAAAGKAALDRAAADVVQIKRLRPDDEDGDRLASAIASRRERNARDTARAARRGVLRAAAAVTVTVVAAVSLAAVVLLELARRETGRERDAKATALAAESNARTRADARARRIRALGLARAAIDAEDTDPGLALLLAMESVDLDETARGASALHGAVLAARRRAEFVADGSPVSALAVSPDGARVATGDFAGRVRVWARTGALQAEFDPHEQPVFSLAFARDGTHVVSGSVDGSIARSSYVDGASQVSHEHVNTVWASHVSLDGTRILTADPWGHRVDSSDTAHACLWDASGAVISRISVPDSLLTGAVLFPNGERVVTVHADGTARLWEGGGELRRTWQAHAGFVLDVAVSPDGRYVATAGAEDGAARVWNAEGDLEATLDVEGPGVGRLFFAPDGERLLTTSGRSLTTLWRIDGERIASLGANWSQHFRRTDILDAAFSPDGRLIALANGGSGRSEGAIALWDPQRDQVRVVARHGARGSRVRFSPDGAVLYSAGHDGACLAISVAGSEAVEITRAPNALRALDYAPDGSRLLGNSANGMLHVWSAAGDAEVGGESARTGTTAGACFLGDGTRVLSANGQQLQLRVVGGPAESLWTAPGASGIRSITPLADGVRAIVIPNGGTDPVIVAAGAAAPQVLACPAGQPLHCAVSPDGGRIAISVLEGRTYVWDERGAALGTFGVGLNSPTALVFTQDARAVVVGTEYTGAVLVPLDGAEPTTLPSSDGSVCRGIAVSAGRGHIAVALSDGTIHTYDSNGIPLAVLRGHETAVNAVAFSPDGNRLASCGDDGTARIWEFGSRDPVVLTDANAPVRALAWHPDGRTLATGAVDGAVRIRLVETQDLLAVARARSRREFTRDERERYGDLLPTRAPAANR